MKKDKSKVIKFTKEYYDKFGEVPTVKTILRRQDLNRNVFYEVFPEGLAELCRLAGIPIPKNRLLRVQKALENRTALKEREAYPQQGSPPRLTLSPEATMRVYGISQLEGGVNPSQIIDQLLDLDTERRSYKLSLVETTNVAYFSDFVISRNWNLHTFVDFLTSLWNIGILNLSNTTLINLISLVQGIDLNYWGSIEKFIEYATRCHNRIGSYKAYLEGKISIADLLRTEGYQ